MHPFVIYLLLLFISLQRIHAANPPTVVIDLNEKFLEVKDEGFWIVKFYAPWCAHCKRLAPTWEHLGHELQDRHLPVRVAKMDCTRFQSACHSMEIRGYPTVIFFRNGRRVEYMGERTKEALVSFCTKSAAPIVEVVNSNKLSDIRRNSRLDPTFLIVGEEMDELRSEFEGIADEFFSKTKFICASTESTPSDVRNSGARIVVFKDDTFFPYSGPDLKAWVLSERFPRLPQASSANLHDMASSEKLIVLVVVTELGRLNKTSPIGQFYEKVSKSVVEIQKLPDLRAKYQFGWLDGGDLASSIAMTAIAPPALLVFNYSSYEYFLPDDEPLKMTSSSLVAWLEQLSEAIENNSIVPLGGRSWTTRIRRMVYEVYSNVAQMFAAQPLLTSCLFGVPTAFLSIICYSICSADFSVDRDEFYPEDEEEEEGETEEEYIPDPNHQKNE